MALLRKSDRLFDTLHLRQISELDAQRSTCSSYIGYFLQIRAREGVVWINLKRTSQGCFRFFIAGLHDQTDAQISPIVWEATAHLDDLPECQLCLLPLALPHQAHRMHEAFLALDELLHSDGGSVFPHGLLKVLAADLQFGDERAGQFAGIVAGESNRVLKIAHGLTETCRKAAGQATIVPYLRVRRIKSQCFGEQIVAFLVMVQHAMGQSQQSENLSAQR